MTILMDNVISPCTKEQNIKNGQLIDITKTAKEAGIAIPTAVTKAVWDYMIDNEKKFNEKQIDIKTWDVCFTLNFAIRRLRENNNNAILYPVVRIQNNSQKEVLLKAIRSPGVHFEPVFTILMPDED